MISAPPARHGARLPRSASCSSLNVDKWDERDGIVELLMDVLISRALLSASPYSLLSEDGKPHLHFVIQEDPPA